MTSAQITIEFLSKVHENSKNEILSHIASNYGITVEEAYIEVTDNEAESLLDYVNGNVRVATNILMQKYLLFKSIKNKDIVFKSVL